MGLRQVVTPVGHDCLFNGVVERFRTQPWGVFGGAAGAGGQFRFADGAGAARVLPPKTGNQVLTAAEKVIIDTPGAGRTAPRRRAPERGTRTAARASFPTPAWPSIIPAFGDD